jgi:hypothetical protein
MSTRRQLLAAAGAAAAALARPPVASAVAGEPAAILALIALEDAAAAAYARAAATTGQRLLERIAAQDVDHGNALRVALEALTVIPPHHADGAERDDPAASALAASTGRAEALDAAIAFEERAQRAYAGAAAALATGGLLQTAGSIFGSHAQQLAVLRAAAGRPPLREAIVSAS